jgi:hypothetical protein
LFVLFFAAAPCCLPTASGIIEIAALARNGNATTVLDLDAAAPPPVAVAGTGAGASVALPQAAAAAAAASAAEGGGGGGAKSSALWDNPVSQAWSAPGAVHCWNCGGVGHVKEDCPLPPSGLTKGQIRRRRKFANRRTVRKRHFLRHLYINRTFYQDRLGTNIGKVEKRVAFFLGRLDRHHADCKQSKPIGQLSSFCFLELSFFALSTTARMNTIQARTRAAFLLTACS